MNFVLERLMLQLYTIRAVVVNERPLRYVRSVIAVFVVFVVVVVIVVVEVL